MKTAKKIAFQVMSLFLIFSLVFPLAGCNKKKDAERKHKCEAVVEDYFEYLKRGKNEKLSRCCDPDNDPLQNLDDSQKTLAFLLFQKTVTYEIGEIDLDGDDATVKVYATVRNGSDVQHSLSSKPSLKDLEDTIDKISASVNKTLELELSYDKSGDCYMIDSGEPVFNMIERQVKYIYDYLDYTDYVNSKDEIDDFVAALRNFDLDYLKKHSDIDLDEYVKEFAPLYKTEMQTVKWSHQIEEQTDEYSIVTFKFEKKDAENAMTPLINDKNTLGQMLAPFAEALVHGKITEDEDNFWKYLDLDAVNIDFARALDTSGTSFYEIKCKITNDPNGNGSFFNFMDGTDDIEDILPEPIYMEYLEDISEEDQYDIYLVASEMAYAAKLIDADEYAACVKTFSPPKLTVAEAVAVLEKYGMTSNDPDMKKAYLSFEDADGKYSMQIYQGDSFEDAYAVVQDDYQSSVQDIKNGSVNARIEGGPLRLWCRGEIEGNEIEIYGCVIRDKYYLLSYFPQAPEDKERMKALLMDLGLDA